MRALMGAIALALIMAFAGISLQPTATAASGPVYPVMNTSEYPPDGIYFRNSPNWNDTSRVSGWGVYIGERVQLQCWDTGSNVPRRDGGTNLVWYTATNVTRPTVQGPRANTGWINAHFVNDGTGPNQVAPGVPRCGSTPPTVRAAYFSPFPPGQWLPGGGPVVRNIAKGDWSSTNCDTSRAIKNVPASATILAGWSLGRLGPVYTLARANDAQKRQMKYIMMIDPGTYHELSTSCDNQRILTGQPFVFKRPGVILAEWLNVNSSARLVILAGDTTADRAHPINRHAHAGIQNVYFNDMRAAGIDRSRVLVCNYSVPGTNPYDDRSLNWSHQAMYKASRQYIPSAPTGCPNLAGINNGSAWHP